MIEHGVAAQFVGVARQLEVMVLDAVKQVVILPAPTPELVAEPVDSDVLFRRHGGYSSEIGFVR